MRPFATLPSVLTLRILTQGRAAPERLTITRGQLGWAVAATRRINAQVRQAYTLLGEANGVTYILWRERCKKCK